MKKQKAPSSAVILSPAIAGNRLWHFSADGGKPKLESSLAVPAGKTVPAKVARKNWMTFVQPRLNIAWLPADQLFIRVVQMPQADAAEIGSMLEFQLEKLSPLPVAQIVWGYELVPSREINNITALVIIASRELVEQKLGALEQTAFQADRLELPHVYQLISEIPETDGVWIYPWSEDGKELALTAWWFNGTLQNLQLIHLPTAGDRPVLLKDQLLKTAWAGEMEGWLNFPVKWHIVAPAGTADDWRKVFENWADGPVEITEQFPADRLAEFAARRAIRGEPSANLLLPEFAARYRQEFIDRLWMRGLAAAMFVYILVVLGYFIAVQALRVRVAQVKKQVAGISQSYTNAQQLKAQVGILQEQSNLKYAALDCLKTASDLLPTDVTLTSLILQDGKILKLRGTAENSRALSDYNETLRTATIGGQPLFKSVDAPSPSSRPGGSGLLWSFDAHLNRREIR